MRTFTHTRTSLAGALTAAAILFSGCGNSDSFVFTNQVNQNQPVQPAPPVAENDAFQALGNATLNQAAPGVLANDTVNGADISGFDAVGSQGGAITLSADGSFTYSPVTGFVGAETFTYTLTNDGGDSTATVTLTSTGFGRFVDNSVPDGGTGTQADPFDTLAEAASAAQPGDTIYVAQGNAPYLGGLTLPVGVNLVGEGTGLVLGQTIEPAGTAPVLEGPIIPLGENTVRGLTIDGSVDTELVQISNVSDVTITECTLSNPDNGLFIAATNLGGSFSLTSNIFDQPSDSDDDWIRFVNEDTNATVVVTDNTFLNEAQNSTDELLDFIADGTSVTTLDYSRNTADGSSGTLDYGISVRGLGTLSSVDLSCRDNLFRNIANEPLSIRGVSGVIGGNVFSSCGSSLFIRTTGQNLHLVDNVVTDFDDRGIAIDNGSGAEGTIIIENNRIENSSGDGINRSGGTASLNMVLRNNTITGSGGNSVDIRLSDNATFCLEVVGNTVDDDMDFNGSVGTSNIERRDQLQSLNTFTAGMPVFQGNTVDVPAGTCMIP